MQILASNKVQHLATDSSGTCRDNEDDDMKMTLKVNKSRKYAEFRHWLVGQFLFSLLGLLSSVKNAETQEKTLNKE